MRQGAKLAVLVLALLGTELATAAEIQEHASFVTCPLFRDAANQCWLAEHRGRLYYIGRVGQEQPPELLHRVLVQGTVKSSERSCGGIVVEPITLSVLPELDYSCNTVLPDNGDKPSEPSMFEIPLDVQLQIGAPQPDPTGPFSSRNWEIYFGHDSLFLHQISQRVVEQAFRYARAGKAKRIELRGRAADSRLDDGAVLREAGTLGRQRAEEVRAALVGLGWPAGKITISWDNAAAAGEGVGDAARRSVAIHVTL